MLCLSTCSDANACVFPDTEIPCTPCQCMHNIYIYIYIYICYFAELGKKINIIALILTYHAVERVWKVLFTHL